MPSGGRADAPSTAGTTDSDTENVRAAFTAMGGRPLRCSSAPADHGRAAGVPEGGSAPPGRYEGTLPGFDRVARAPFGSEPRTGHHPDASRLAPGCPGHHLRALARPGGQDENRSRLPDGRLVGGERASSFDARACLRLRPRGGRPLVDREPGLSRRAGEADRHGRVQLGPGLWPTDLLRFLAPTHLAPRALCSTPRYVALRSLGQPD